MDPNTYDAIDSLSCSWYSAAVGPGSCVLASNVDVVNNIIRDMEGSGVILAAVNATRVAHNTLVRVAKGGGAGIELWAAQVWVSPSLSPMLPVSNTVIGNNVVLLDAATASPAVALVAVSDWGPSGAVVGAVGPRVYFQGNSYWKATRAALYNSSQNPGLFSARAPGSLPFVSAWYQRNTIGSAGAAAAASPGSLWFPAVWFRDTSPGLFAPGRRAFSFADWVGAGALGREPSPGPSADPALDDSGAPVTGSPLRGAASTLPSALPVLPLGASAASGSHALFAAITTDRFGVPRLGLGDIGAVQASSNASCTAGEGPDPAWGASPPSPSSLPPWDASVAQVELGPGSALPNASTMFVPGWHNSTPSSGLSEAAVFASCLAGGSMFAKVRVRPTREV